MGTSTREGYQGFGVDITETDRAINDRNLFIRTIYLFVKLGLAKFHSRKMFVNKMGLEDVQSVKIVLCI